MTWARVAPSGWSQKDIELIETFGRNALAQKLFAQFGQFVFGKADFRV